MNNFIEKLYIVLVYTWAFFAYHGYIARHRWYVFVECFHMRLLWRGFVHDLSKYLPSEFFPYMVHFYIQKKHDIEGEEERFDMAWLKHIHRNKHHWQYWVLIEDDEANHKVMEMPDKYKKEMFADWRGASQAKGYGKDIRNWVSKNIVTMELHPNTKAWIKKRVGLPRKFCAAHNRPIEEKEA